MKRLSILFLLLVTTTVSVIATDNDKEAVRRTIRGVVLDENGEPLPGASVRVVGTTIGAGTNTNGEFILLLRESGAQTLHVSFTGYIPQKMKVEGTDTKAVSIKMHPAVNELNEIVVTGSRIEKPLKDIPVITRVISNEAIRQVNAPDLSTLLQYALPGLQIGYDSMSQNSQITYQGVGGAYLVFLVDGERVSGEGADHNVDFTRFNVDDIERIEVVRGAASTLYDSNALGGVINIITKSANRPFSGNLSARYAGNNGENYSFSAGAKQSRFSTFTTLGYRHRSTYTVTDKEGQTTTTTNPDGSTNVTQDNAYGTTMYGYRIWDASQKFGYAITDKLSAEVKGTYYHNKRDIRQGKKYRDVYEDFTVNGKLKYVFNVNHQLDASYVFDKYDKDKVWFTLPATTDYSNLNQTGRINYSGNIGNHTLSAGTEWQREYLKHYMLKDSGDVSRIHGAIYLQEDWKMTDNLNLIVGLRGDYEQKYDFHITPKVSAMYRPCEFFTLRAGYSQGYRSPSLKELYQAYDMGGLGMFMLYGNENLKPEHSHQYTVSAEMNSGGLNASLSAYHNRFKDKISLALMNDGTNDQQYINAENAKTTGLEAIVRWRSETGVSLTGSYAYVDDYEEVDGRNTSSVRPHSITFNAAYTRKFGKINGSLALNGQWASGLDTYNVGTDGSYSFVTLKARTLCSLNANVQFPRGISLGFMIDNLFNYKDKSYDRAVQVPQKGISYVGILSVNLADLFKL